ncbi:ABC transporter substrate-binding protein [Naasia lichenicola]|uniref:ABC transporter substrate-binding protein n=1 Tax=Naasia lichenicola TaxID=2565933 RepID=A0A4S4FRM1_9MICO|nr:ABC transporter substrate-binding protein [Naasia lichenicola]THG33303.1 ABC transporter substrate-binding protein [Naasia lichenicola]
MPHNRRRRILALGLTAATAISLAACSTSTDTASESDTDLTIGSTDLSGVCPATIVYQDSWFPQAEIGYLFQLLGSDYTVDTDKKSVSGPLMADGEYTGVSLELRSGGPAIGFQAPSNVLYTDPDVTFAPVGLDSALQLSKDFPTVSVYAPLDKSPLMVMWDPATYPDVSTIADLGPALEKKGGYLRYSEGTAFIQYLTDDGQVPESVLDGSYDGTPGTFVASAGTLAQQGYASNEPYVYANELPEWDKPVDYQLLADAGWDFIPATLAVRQADLESLSPCLEKLIPVIQKAEVAYYDDPSTANAIILKLVDEYQSGQVYSADTIDAAITVLKDEDLASNGADDMVGNFDEDRVSDFYDTAAPIYAQLGNPQPDGLTPEDLYTNEFVDSSIGF